LARAVAHHQHRVFAHIGGEEVARLGELALMAKKEPTAGEYSFQLLLVNLGLDKDPAADKSGSGIDQTSDIHPHSLPQGVFRCRESGCRALRRDFNTEQTRYSRNGPGRRIGSTLQCD
jgi:hypothetical protein